MQYRQRAVYEALPYKTLIISAMRAETYDFGPFTLDISGRVPRRGHELISLTPKLFDTLTLLVRNQGKLLTKEEIIREVWPDASVEEGSISQSVFQLRRIIGEAFMQTAPRRGYRFVPSTTIASIAYYERKKTGCRVRLSFWF